MEESAGQTVQDDAPNNPTQGGGVTTSTSPTNAESTQTTESTGPDGLDAPVRTFTETQSTSAGMEWYDDAPTAPTAGGVGKTDDSSDNIPEIVITAKKDSKATITGVADTNTRKQITPQPNVLDRFGSYTWKASVYLMSPQEYNQFTLTRNKTINGYRLLFQSGGAPNNVGGFQGALAQTAQANRPDAPGWASGIPDAGQKDAGRSPAFPNDFFIDSISFDNNILGRNTQAAINVSNLKFTVVEPMGITLLDRLWEAVQDAVPKDGAGSVNYAKAQYLMVIRFYGYDENGNQIIAGALDPKTGLTDPNAVVEKFIPFEIARVNWTVGTGLCRYEFECSSVSQSVAAGTGRATVPYDMELTASTVGSLLSSSPNYSTATTSSTKPGSPTTIATQASAMAEWYDGAPSPPKASAAPTTKATVTNGLSSVLTEFQKTLTVGDRAIFNEYDEFEIVFAKGAEEIRDALLVQPGKKVDASLTGTAPPPTTDPKSASPNASSKDVTTTNIRVVAGQPIVQVIDNVIRNSSYIKNQALTVYDDVANQEVANPAAIGKTVNWFKISFTAAPKKYDPLRNSFAYKITYTISKFPIDKFDSKYFPVGQFRGVHKSYPYWFTGKNTAVIDYKENLNTSYTNLVSGTNPKDSKTEQLRRNLAMTQTEMIEYTYGPASGENRQGSAGRGNEESANLADSLYGSSELGEVHLRIIGDPAWIQQGSLTGAVTAQDWTINSFLPDGTINFDAEQVFFDVQWNRPQDYDINTGTAQPNLKKYPMLSRVYQATRVTNEFTGGKYETVVHGSIWKIPRPDGSNKAPNAPMPSQASVRAIDNAIDSTLQKTRSGIGGSNPENLAKSAPTPVIPPTGGTDTTNTAPPGPVDDVQPGMPAEPPTTGSGEDISYNDFDIPVPTTGRITIADIAPDPVPPQDIVREA